MTSKPRAKEGTASPSQAEGMTTGVEKKRKLSDYSEYATKINRIKLGLAEVMLTPTRRRQRHLKSLVT